MTKEEATNALNQAFEDNFKTMFVNLIDLLIANDHSAAFHFHEWMVMRNNAYSIAAAEIEKMFPG